MCDDIYLEIAQRTNNLDLANVCSAIVEASKHPHRSFLMEMIQRFKSHKPIVDRINLVETLSSDEIIRQIRIIYPSDIKCPTKLSTSNTPKKVFTATLNKLIFIMMHKLTERRENIVCGLLISNYIAENIRLLHDKQEWLKKIDEFSKEAVEFVQYKELFDSLRG